MNEGIKAIDATAAPQGVGRFGVREQNSGAAASGVRDDADQAVEAADMATLQAALGDAGRRLAEHGVDLTYRVDSDLRRVIVEVVDRRDGTVLRQIPGEEALRLARMMQDGAGSLLQESA